MRAAQVFLFSLVLSLSNSLSLSLSLSLFLSISGVPLNNLRVRGHADPYTQHKRDGAHMRKVATV
jgi:hypothetical protein